MNPVFSTAEPERGSGVIVIARNKLKFLQAGRTLTIPDASGRYRKGRTYALGTTPRHTCCRVQILEADAGTIQVRIVNSDPIRLLARNPIAQHADYVAEPMRAMADEPEALSAEDLERLAALASMRRHQDLARRHSETQAIPLAQRLQRVQDAHDRGETAVAQDLRIIHRRIRQTHLAP